MPPRLRAGYRCRSSVPGRCLPATGPQAVAEARTRWGSSPRIRHCLVKRARVDVALQQAALLAGADDHDRGNLRDARAVQHGAERLQVVESDGEDGDALLTLERLDSLARAGVVGGAGLGEE